MPVTASYQSCFFDVFSQRKQKNHAPQKKGVIWVQGHALRCTIYVQSIGAVSMFFTQKSRGGKCPSRRVTGAANRAWTGDLVLTKDVLYLLSHSSKPITVIYYTLSLPLCQALFSTFLLWASCKIKWHKKEDSKWNLWYNVSDQTNTTKGESQWVT